MNITVSLQFDDVHEMVEYFATRNGNAASNGKPKLPPPELPTTAKTLDPVDVVDIDPHPPVSFADLRQLVHQMSRQHKNIGAKIREILVRYVEKPDGEKVSLDEIDQQNFPNVFADLHDLNIALGGEQ